MDDLFGVIVVIFGIIAAIAKNAEKKKKAQERTRQIQTAVPRVQAKPQAKPKAESILPPEAPAAPAVRQEIAPRVETRVRVSSHLEDYQGSLHAESTEGVDPCHEEQLELRPAPQMAPVWTEQPGISLEWTGENMVKAFIMQEVLTRPCDRRRRA